MPRRELLQLFAFLLIPLLALRVNLVSEVIFTYIEKLLLSYF